MGNKNKMHRIAHDQGGLVVKGFYLISIAFIVLIAILYGWQYLWYPKGETVYEQIAHLPELPSLEEVPPGNEGKMIRDGYDYFVHTNQVLPEYVGNQLSCASCHADGGTGPSINLVGVNNMFPQYNSRSGTEIVLEDRIQQCFERSMSGVAPDKDSYPMQAMVAYIKYISKNVPPDMKSRPWAQNVAIKTTLPEPNIDNGRIIYARACVACHGLNGEGGGFGPNAGPALWGDGSFNIGAGMGRVRTIAGYIQKYMPKVQMGLYTPGNLTTQEAVDLAAYILSHPRPDRPNPHAKTVPGASDWSVDWPKAEQPDDIAYFNRVMLEQGLDQKVDTLPWYTAFYERFVKQKEAKK